MEYLEKTFKLPSNGLFGGPKEITLREMTTKEEKIIMSAKDFNIFENLIKSCCRNSDFDFNKISGIDVMYLVYMLRELSFGPEYAQQIQCPYCNAKQEVTIDISQMKVNILSSEEVEKYENGVEVELSTGDKITLKMLSLGEVDEIDKIVSLKTQQNKLKNPETYESMLKLSKTITKIESKESPNENYDDDKNKMIYIDSLRMKDLNKIKQTFTNVKFGIDRINEIMCNNCGEIMEVNGYIVPEFFHPSK
jgi:hypothetical protein